jgi:hypothetical protein
LGKLLPILVEPGWFCTLALKSRPLEFLKKSFLDPQHVIYSLNFDREGETPHRLGASGSFCALSWHAGLKLTVTNSKKSKNARTLHSGILCHLDVGKNSNREIKCLP